MKFTDGYWLARPEVTPHLAAGVQEVRLEPSALTVYAPTRPIVTRGDTLDQGLITVRYSSPLPNVIRVQMAHHLGGRAARPAFALEPHPAPPVVVQDDAQAATLTSGQLSVRVRKGGGWLAEFIGDERVITSSGWRAAGIVDTPTGRYIHEQLSLGVGEYVYGLGERFTPFVKNGQAVDLWNEDGGTSSEQAYKNIPFYLTNRGYGVFINQPERVSLEVASEKVERVQFSVPGERLEYFVIYGPSPKEVLERYTALTGRPPLLPPWSFGLWLSTSFTTDYDEASVTGLIQGMAERRLPLSVFHFDCFWMRELHWVDLTWDERVFPDPAAMLRRLKARGLRICLWINPYVAQQSVMFDEGVTGGYLLKRADGSVWQWDRWQAGMALVDFTNADARQWFGAKLRGLLALGVDCFKTDFGERIPTDVVYADGADPVRMHNYYSYLYNRTVFEVLEQERSPGEAILFARSATTGGQQFPVHWGGDCTATYESMAESLRGGLSLALSGFGFWSHDMGGFEQTATPDLYKRWCAFGLLSSHSRLHGNQSYRVPWLFDEEAVEVLRFFTNLKCRLMPYLYAAAEAAHATGVPMLRAMLLEFPDDPACETLDRQYMLGEALLVAPVFRPDGVVDYYVPEGRWTHLLSGAVVEGGRWRREQHGYLSLPLLVRPNTVLPVGGNDQQPDYAYADGVTFHVFEPVDGATVTARVPAGPGADGLTVTVRRTGTQLTVDAPGATRPYRVLLRGVPGLAGVEDGSAQEDALGTLVIPAAGATRLTVRLPGG
jgi:alpha-D-xyloside xylohydrolase